MDDTVFITRLTELDSKGKDGIAEMRDMLKANGGMSRVIALLAAKKRTPRERAPRLEIEGFADFYATFPKHVGRYPASQAYKNARQIADADTLLAGAKRYAAQTISTKPEHIKAPTAWLNDRRWLDEYPTAVEGNNDHQSHDKRQTSTSKHLDGIASLISDIRSGGE